MTAVKSTNPVVRNALAANADPDWVGASAVLAGFALSDDVRKKREEAKRRARGEVGHAVRDLKDAMPLFDILMRTGDTVNGYPADVAAKTVRESVGILSRIFGV
jgi:hypothetical protein